MRRLITSSVRLAVMLIAPFVLTSMFGAGAAEGSGRDWFSRVRAIADNTQSLVALEADAIRRDTTWASRTSGGLSLKVRSGSTVSFRDSPNCTSEDVGSQSHCSRYIYLGHDGRRGLYLIFEAHYEGGWWIILNDATGAQTRVAAFPEISRNGTCMAVFLNDSLVGPAGVEIWVRHGVAFVREYNGIPILKVYEHAYTITTLESWLAERVIAIRTETFVGSSQEPIVNHVIMRARNSHWTVSANRASRFVGTVSPTP
jgi:hypothetical protein